MRDDEVRYALGAAQFLRAFERFGQALYRHGFAPAEFGCVARQFQMAPGGDNPSPQPLSYTQFRRSVANFVDDLDRACDDAERASIPAA